MRLSHSCPVLVGLLLVPGLVAAEKTPDRPRLDRHGDPLPSGAIARLGTLRLHFNGDRNAAALSPDGKLIAAADPQGEAVQVWDATTGQRLRLLRGQARNRRVDHAQQDVFGLNAPRVFGLAFSPDGNKLAAVFGLDAVVWEVATGKEVRRFRFRGAPTEPLVYCRDGTTLAAWCNYDRVYWYDIATGKLLRCWDCVLGRQVVEGAAVPTRKGKARAIASPDGSLVAAFVTIWAEDRPGAPGLARDFAAVWDTARGKELWHGDLSGSYSGPISFSADGRLLAAHHAGEVLVWEAATGKRLWALSYQGPAAGATLALSANGGVLAAASPGRVVRLWDLKTGKPLRPIPIYPEPGDSSKLLWVSLSRDGKRLAMASGVTIRLFDTATGQESPRLEGHRSPVETVAFAPDGKSLATASVEGFSSWETDTWKETHRGPLAPGTDRGPSPVALGPEVYLYPDDRGRLAVFDLTTRKILRRLPFGEKGVPEALSGDGRTAVLVSVDDQGNTTLTLIDTETGKTLGRKGGLKTVERLTVVSSRLVAWVGEDALLFERPLHLWDGKKRVWRPNKDGWEPELLAVSPDGRRLATASQLRVCNPTGPDHFFWLTLHDLASGKPLPPPASLPGPAACMAFSPDGRMLATGHAIPDGSSDPASLPSVCLWEVATGKLRLQLSGHQRSVRSLAISPDGRLLVSGSADATALVWDPWSPGKEVPRKQEMLWKDLASPDAENAYRASCAILTLPGRGAAFLKERLKPVPVVEPERLRRLVSDLSSERFAVRERAARELESLREQAEPILREALKGKPTLELRRRVERLLKKLKEPIPSPEVLRELRAIEVLEMAATARGRHLLENLAGGFAGARLTQEAKAALGRLQARDRETRAEK
jgi:WD40 repeat protein